MAEPSEIGLYTAGDPNRQKKGRAPALPFYILLITSHNQQPGSL